MDMGFVNWNVWSLRVKFLENRTKRISKTVVIFNGNADGQIGL
jgi:hypothetical protein